MGDDHWAQLPGGRAVVERVDDNVYLAASLRNVGSGIVVLHGWRLADDLTQAGAGHPDPAGFRPQLRDLYVPAGDTSFWQAALRDPDDPDRPGIVGAVEDRRLFGVDLLYSDHEGGQRTISRFSISPRGDQETEWLCSVVRHWSLDRPDPREPPARHYPGPTSSRRW